MIENGRLNSKDMEVAGKKTFTKTHLQENR
jgi:hypothetical protein